jgi:beta-1,4-mannosyl-glycoprotein beta-1,4-N-acetylglucosaminyltransferase
MVDVVPLRNELDVLELRFRELDDLVDRFIVIQGEETHAGVPKPIYFNPTDARWEPWQGRVSTVIMPRMTDVQSRWDREHQGRHVIAGALESYAPDDLVIISDVDEIPDKEKIRALSGGVTPDCWLGFLTSAYYYYLNLLTGRSWPCIGLARVDTVRRLGAQWIRDHRTNPPSHRIRGGWHFSWLGGVDAIREKIEAFAHAEFDTDYYKDPTRISEKVCQQRDLLDYYRHKHFDKWKRLVMLPERQFQQVGLEELPGEVKHHPERYARYLLPEAVGGSA